MIEIVAYKNEWPEIFRKTGAEIRQAVGNHAHAIHHIGSTSVPLLAAKDVIDIQMTVLDLEAPIEAALKNLGFELGPHRQDHCPPGLTLAASELEKRYYRGPARKFHLHIRKLGTFNQRYALLFRDFLRATPMAADAYGEIKRQLAKRFANDTDSYYDIKDPVCDALMAGGVWGGKKKGWGPRPPGR